MKAIVFAPLVTATWVVMATGAAAQVKTDDGAISALQKSAPAAAPATPAAPASSSAAAKKAATAHGMSHLAKPTAGPPPIMPKTPPTNPVLQPIPFVMPEHPPPPPPALQYDKDAVGSVVATDKGPRVLFGPDSFELNDAMQTAVAAMAARLKADPALTVTVTGYAPGTPQDPSPARRLSLSRALACRAVLIHEGIASERIYARAQGFLGIGGDPADRVDIALVVPKESTPATTPSALPVFPSPLDTPPGKAAQPTTAGQAVQPATAGKSPAPAAKSAKPVVPAADSAS